MNKPRDTASLLFFLAVVVGAVAVAASALIPRLLRLLEDGDPFAKLRGYAVPPPLPVPDPSMTWGEPDWWHLRQDESGRFGALVEHDRRPVVSEIQSLGVDYYTGEIYGSSGLPSSPPADPPSGPEIGPPSVPDPSGDAGGPPIMPVDSADGGAGDTGPTDPYTPPVEPPATISDPEYFARYGRDPVV